jgi:tripartite-type tricarboxylate transporter receptor subunit TctC
MKLLKTLALVSAAALVMAMPVFGNGSQQSGGAAPTFKGKNVRVVIGSTSTSGDSYLIAETTMRYLSKVLGCNMKVDAVGAAKALDAMQTAKPDGNTIMMFHDMTYLGISFGAYDKKYALENMTVGPLAAQNPTSAWLTYKDAPYTTLKDVADWLKANPGKTVRFCLEAGGVSQLGFAAYYDWVVKTYGADVAKGIKVVIGGSTADKDQHLWDRTVDVIFADYTSQKQYTETSDPKIAMKYCALMDNMEGVNVPSFKDEGITLPDGKPFAFSKNFVIYLPKNFPPSLLAELDAGVQKVCNDPKYKADLAKMFFRPAYKSSADAKTYIYNLRNSLDSLIKTSPSLDSLQ